MNLKSYLNLYELLQNDTSTHEENRAFALTQVGLKNKNKEQLLAWVEEHSKRLNKPRISETFSSYLYGITLTLVIIASILGFLSGLGLLAYSGHEPVNVIYFMAMVIFIPLFTMSLSLVSMFRANRTQSLLVHISPAFWMEKIVRLLPHKIQDNIKELKINPLVSNWVVIKRSQIIALFFSLGLLLALLAMVVTKDIAFAWSTTLEITPQSFHSFLYLLSFPWRELYPWAVPSLELIEYSQYFRLGDKLSEQMLSHASQLGQWWKFLVFATIFYAILLRIMLFILSIFGLKSAIKKSFLTLRGVGKILREMNEPIISTHASKKEEVFVPTKNSSKLAVDTLDISYDVVQGWGIRYKELLVLNDSMHVTAPQYFEVGGANSLAQDSEVVSKSDGKVLLYVKGWEPPTMDFVDYLSELTQKVDKVILMPVGTVENHYSITGKELDIWDRKISLFPDEKVWLKR